MGCDAGGGIGVNREAASCGVMAVALCAEAGGGTTGGEEVFTGEIAVDALVSGAWAGIGGSSEDRDGGCKT